ncbi:MAG: DUF2769 domain-containing protein [Candidatus Buchananbacteria bacterium]|nr:DUF2769 domain-containing protein [Candidatus Buchananbacteria bacterium]
MKVENNPGNQAKCVCPNCPSYDECMEEKKELLFCSVGATACSMEQKGCICGSCPIKIENGLSSGYYCVSGAEK